MGFNFSSLNSNSTVIHFLEYDDFDPNEYLDKLTQLELERLRMFKHIKRQREFVATRLLRHNLFGFEHIHYDNHGAPYIEHEGYISISHSKNKVAIALNKDYRIGVDLEPHRMNILNVAHKFLSSDELRTFDCTDPIVVTKIWSAKEAMYKLAGRKKILFSTELLLNMRNDEWIGLIDNYDHELLVKLDIFDIDNTIITINSQEIEKRHKNIGPSLF